MTMRNTVSRLHTVKELFAYLWAEKMWWMIPMIIVLLVFGTLLIFAQASAIAPFIYTLF